MRTDRATMMRALTLVVGLGLGLAAATAPAALVTVSGSETWDGTANPHAADGVTLVTNAGPVYVYTIPDGMHITGTGVIKLGVTTSVTLQFQNGGLQIDAGGNINPDTGTTRWPFGASVRLSTSTFTLDLGTNSLTGSGDMKGANPWAPNYLTIGKHNVMIRGTGGVSLNSVYMETKDSCNGNFTVQAAGPVSIGSINVSGVDGSRAATAVVRASQVTVSNVYAYSQNTVSGNVRLDAVAYPYFGYQAWATNSLANTLTIRGIIQTRNGTSSGGSVAVNGVNLTLGPGFNTNLNADTSLILRYGSGGTFTDNSGKGITAEATVLHKESPPADAKPQIIVYTNETWNGVANPREADGVTLASGTYTLPGELYVTQIGTMTLGDSGNVKFTHTNGGFRMDADVSVNVTVGRWSARTLTLDLGGYDLLGGAKIAGGGFISNSSYGSRGVVITNAGNVALDTLAPIGHGATHGDVSVTAAGTVRIATLSTHDTDDQPGRNITVRGERLLLNTLSSYSKANAGNITLRGAQVEASNATAYCSGSGTTAGNILVEALKTPELDPTRPINTKNNTLIARGQLRTGVATAKTAGNVTLRGAVVTLESGFSTNLNANGVFAIYAGDREPHATYFINKTANPSFTATHNVQLVPPPGTMIAIR